MDGFEIYLQGEWLEFGDVWEFGGEEEINMNVIFLSGIFGQVIRLLIKFRNLGRKVNLGEYLFLYGREDYELYFG